jgi:hypothetical protein
MTGRRELDLQVKQACCNNGVTVTTFSAYHAFALQVEKARRRVGGDDLVRAVDALVERYVALGLQRKVLWYIATNVYTVFPPRTPPKDLPE